MRVLMITPDYPPSFGGIGTHVYNLVEKLSLFGCKITLLICRMRQQSDNIKEFVPNRPILHKMDEQVEIIDFATGIHTEMDNTCNNYSFFSTEAYHDYRTIWNCYDLTTRLLKEFIGSDRRYDLIHLHDAFNGTAANLMKNIFTCPLITTIHGVNAAETTILDNLKRYTIYNSDYLIAVSSATKKAIRERYMTNKKIEVIYNSVHISDKSKVTLNATRDIVEPYYITFCGRIDVLKGVDTLLYAFRKILDKGINAKLQIIGDGLLKREMIELANELGVSKKVEFSGILAQKQVLSCYESSTCVVVPSIKEPFSTVALESMAQGINVVCSRVDGFTEMIEDGKSGYLFRAGDSDELCNKIIKLIEDPINRKTLAINAIDKVSSKFTWDIAAENTMKFYSKVLGTKKQGIVCKMS